MAKVKKLKVPVTERALTQRIQRQLTKQHERLVRSRPGTRAEAELGAYYILRFGRGGSEPSTNVIDTHVDLEELARKVKALAAWEVLVTD